jgi:pimeloyl-ACP methyl ester carboxylesterase
VTETALAPRDHLVKTPKGDVFVREIPGDDPPIVLMHGFPDDHSIYDRLLPLHPALTPLADAMINDDAQRLWLLQFTGDHWGMDALDPLGVAVQSILPQFFASLAREIAGLFTDPSLNVVPDASRWPQHDQPQLVADLLASLANTRSQR